MGTKRAAGRMGRWAWLTRFFGPQAAGSPPASKRKHTPTGRKSSHWWVQLPEGRWVMVEGMTRSEARAAAKRELKLPGRLPAGTVLEKQQ